jgi:hypothetical protein
MGRSRVVVCLYMCMVVCVRILNGVAGVGRV